MKLLFKRYYALLAVILMVPLITVLMQYTIYQRALLVATQVMAEEKMLRIENHISTWVNRRGRQVEIAALGVAGSPNTNMIMPMLRAIKSTDDALFSLYFASIDNELIHADGWVPPAGLDLRLRPWYIRAIQQDGLILSDIFLNASRDSYIATFAKPVRNARGELLGVVGADVLLDTIVALVQDTHITQRARLFLRDGNDLVAYAAGPGEETQSEARTFFTEMLRNPVLPNAQASFTVVLGQRGYVTAESIAGTGWAIMVFMPEADLQYAPGLFEAGFIVPAMSGLLALLLFGYMQQKLVVRPLMSLGQGILAIDVVKDATYRLPSDESADPTGFVAIINGLLARIESYIDRLKESDLALRTLNTNLESAVKAEITRGLELRAQREHWRALFENAPDALVLFDEFHIILAINEGFTKLFGYTSEEVIGKDLTELVAPHKADESDALLLAMTQGEDTAIETTRLHKDGHAIDVDVRGVPLIVEGRARGGYAIYSDISVRKENERKILRMSTYDQLTGVYNRAYFDQVFYELTENGPWPLTLIMGDMNGLKLINDAFGHSAGDAVLKRTAQVLKDVARPEDIVARLGGDEFVLLLPGVDEAEATLVCDRIREQCNDLTDTNIQLSLALGISTAHEPQHREVLFGKAEERMYHQKLLEGRSIRNSLIASWQQVLQEKSHETSEHSQRMTDLAVRLVNYLGLSQSLRDDIEVLAASHDVGKIAIPESILEKAGPLTPEEWEIMKKHSEIGYRIASTSPQLAHIAEAVLQLHERWDGTGYPQNLQGEVICLAARIVAVVDAYDAMLSDRPYRKALSEEATLSEIAKGAGKHFDPAVVAAFLAMLGGRLSQDDHGDGSCG